MSVQLVETYEEDSYAAVAQFVADLLNDGQVGCLCTIHTRSLCICIHSYVASYRA
jgi:hypothetical protein